MPTTQPPQFTIAWLVAQPPHVQQKILGSLTLHEQAALRYHWPAWARPEQLEPAGDWSTWLILAGRGFGKTRAGAKWVRQKKENCSRIALVGETAADCRDVMIEGESGIIAVSPPWDKPVYNPSKREISWSNGAIGKLYSADAPDQLRGPQHDCAWADELAKRRGRSRSSWSAYASSMRTSTTALACGCGARGESGDASAAAPESGSDQRETSMTDNTIDITDRLPPEVRKPWRHKLPECYVKHIDELLAMEKDIRAMQERLAEIRNEIGEEADHPAVEVRSAVDSISEAIVLLKCAEQKLCYATPTEEIMPKESIREFWGK